METLTIISTCPLNEQEIISFLDELKQFYFMQLPFNMRLILVDSTKASLHYSELFHSKLLELNIPVTLSSVKVEKQFYALFQVAFSVSSGLVLTIDPDMHGNFPDVLRMYEEVQQGKRLVFSVRVARDDVPRLRTLGSRFFNGVLQKFFGVPVRDANTPMIMFSAELGPTFKRFPKAAGYPKFYFPHILGDEFGEVEVVVKATPKRSEYSWLKLLSLGLQQIKQAYQFSTYIRK